MIQKSVTSILAAFFYLLTGLVLGGASLEALLRLNPTLLLRGMIAPAPVDQPLLRMEYDVRYSDADVFAWRPDLVRPVSPAEDRLEAHVVYQTDEFGFRNHPPLPAQVDVVVLGRSIALGANMPASWPQLLEETTGLLVLNLAQPGSSLEMKKEHLTRFGLPRSPRWVIVEMTPTFDFIADPASPAWLTGDTLGPVTRSLVQRLTGKNAATFVLKQQPVYPLAVDLPGRQAMLTCCIHLMETYTLDRQSLEASLEWKTAMAALLEIVETARSGSACPALLLSPFKPEIYFQLALDPGQLLPTLRETVPYGLSPQGSLIAQPGKAVPIETVVRNTTAGRDALKAFAMQHGLLFIDPTPALAKAVIDGVDPFMAYDTHWNDLGNRLVAQSVQSAIAAAPCP